MGAGKIETPGLQQSVEDQARRFIKLSGPFRREFVRQGTEALTTGGVGARIPLIQQAVSRSNQATSQALTQTADSLAARNIGGPFAGRQLAQLRLQGAQQAAQIPTQVAEQMISNTLPFVSQLSTLGYGALQQGAQMRQASDVFNAQQFTRSVPFMQTGQQGLIGGVCLARECEIETPTGDRPVESLEVGDKVLTQDSAGQKVVGRVTNTISRENGPGHQFLLVQGLRGPFRVSPAHPYINGYSIVEIAAGILMPPAYSTTFDIAVDGDTGIYFVKGFPLGSTLDPRFVRKAAA